MGLFRRRGETLNDKLLREAGLSIGSESPEPPSRPGAWQFGAVREAGVHGLARPREWDVFATVEAPELEGETVDFVCLPDRSLLVERETGEAPLDPLAGAIEARLEPPYRAQAVRKGDALWAISARQIDVREFEAAGEELELVVTPEGKQLLVDGERGFGTVPALERLGELRASSFAARASRLDGDQWEVRISPL